METMTSFDRILKEFYPAGGIVNQLNIDTFLLDKVEKAKHFTNVGGRYLYKPARFGLSGGVGPRPENTALPTPGSNTYDDIQIPIRFHYGVVQVSGPLMAVSKSDKHAFAQALALTMDSMYDEFRLVANILCYGWGSGIVGKVGSVSGANITLADDIHPINWFYEGQKLDVFDTDEITADAGVTNPIQVVGVDYATRVVTVSAGTSIDATDVLVLAGSLNQAPEGLLSAVDDGTYRSTYFGINRTLRPRWKSYIDVATPGTVTKYGSTTRRTITGTMIQGALDAQRQRAGAARPVDQIISSLGVRRMYWNSLSPDRRFDSAIYDGGWEMLKFSNGDRTIPWFGDEYAPRYTVFGLHTGTVPAARGKKTDKVQDEEVLAVYEALPAAWDNAAGGSEMKQVYSGTSFVDAVGAFMKWYYNFGTCRPNLFVRMDDISET